MTSLAGRAARTLTFAAAIAFLPAVDATMHAVSVRRAPGPQRDPIAETHRAEGEAILAIADAAMAGRRVPNDFAFEWQNDFVKAQRGTFVPFTLTIDASALTKAAALVYVRARRRGGRDDTYAVDAIFPVELTPAAGRPSRISRGFSVDPGDYDVFVVLRERVDPGAGNAGKRKTAPKAAVLRQPLSVPEFRSGELTTSSVIVADGLATLAEPVPAERLAERPYAIGRNEITPAADRRFRKTEELVVVLLVYNPTVTAERQFDVKVEYHFFRKAGAEEQYFNHTDPQRFNPALMGTPFDPASGEPLMAGQVVPLAAFAEGDYRLGVQVVDLLSGKTISRDVFFTVGS